MNQVPWAIEILTWIVLSLALITCILLLVVAIMELMREMRGRK